MLRFKHLFVVGVLLCATIVSGQTTDSVNTVPQPRQQKLYYAVPATLILAGTLIALDKDGDEFFVSNTEVREERNENLGGFSFHLDDYLQHVPSASVFALSLSGIKGKHDLGNQALIYIKSEMLMLAAVYSLKYGVAEGRPDTGQKNSFPSGHTAQAFTAATFLSKEYGHKSVWISIGAYSAATTVGVMRMLNNRHWLSDVLVGAGIGILSTEIVFFTHRSKTPRKGIQHLKVDPFSAYGSNGLSVRYKL